MSTSDHFTTFITLLTVSRRALDEARAWLAAIPALRRARVGEFCLFGGTPTVLPTAELERLVDFCVESFGIDANTSMRAEGSPDSLTDDVLDTLRRLGFDTLTYGVQSLDDRLLRAANRRHTGEQALSAHVRARQRGFTRVDGDLVWGLPGQSVDGFLEDVRRLVEAGFSTVVAIKLHLRSFAEASTAIGHQSPAPWEDPDIRERLALSGLAWPSLGQQLQMREQAVALLREAGHYEHPTTYFPHRSIGPQARGRVDPLGGTGRVAVRRQAPPRLDQRRLRPPPRRTPTGGPPTPSSGRRRSHVPALRPGAPLPRP